MLFVLQHLLLFTVPVISSDSATIRISTILRTSFQEMCIINRADIKSEYRKYFFINSLESRDSLSPSLSCHPSLSSSPLLHFFVSLSLTLPVTLLCSNSSSSILIFLTLPLSFISFPASLSDLSRFLTSSSSFL